MTTPLHPCPSRRFLRHGMLPQLAAFEAVVRMGSATRAAESLCIAQPTLSGHLRKLGEALGVRLFEMRGKRLVPTEAALVLLQATREVFAALETCERVLTSVRSDSRPVVHRVDLPHSAGPWQSAAAWIKAPPARGTAGQASSRRAQCEAAPVS